MLRVNLSRFSLNHGTTPKDNVRTEVFDDMADKQRTSGEPKQEAIGNRLILVPSRAGLVNASAQVSDYLLALIFRKQPYWSD
jgi:hypothetical protein